MINALNYLGYNLDVDFYADEGGIHWLNGTPPDQSVVDAASLPARRAAVVSQINAEASRKILAVYPLEKQSSANLGIYPQAYTDQMIADIAAVIAASNTACDAVDAALDVAGVDAVTVNWPVIGG
jgi:hypothetical protein